MTDSAAPAPAGRFAPDERRALRWLFGFVKVHRARLALVLALALATTAVVTFQPYLMKLIIDDGILAGDMSMVAVLTAAMLATGVLNLVLGGLNRFQHVKLSGLVLFSVREAIFAHLQRVSPAFFATMRTGDVLQRLDGDVAEIQRFAVDALLSAIGAVLTLIAALALMLWLNPTLAVIAFVLLPLDFMYLRWMRPKVGTRTRRVRERVSDLSSFLVERVPAIKFIQAMAAESRESERFHGLNKSYLGDLLALQVTEFLTAAVPNLLTSVSRALVFLAGGAMVVRGDFTLGGLIAFSTYLGFAVGPVQGLLGLYVAMTRMRVSLGRVMVLTDAPVAVAEPEAPRSLPSAGGGAVRLEKVGFTYPGGAGPVLTDADLDVPPGAKVGVIGASGAGKTTLIDLLHRHYDPDRGRILIDGIDIRSVGLGDLRRHVAVVAQDGVLFRGSIGDAIRYARPDAPMDAVRDAARRAQIDGFIDGLPQGYDTPIGERGARLSGGQRQRLAIARAILQEPAILVLDEATSAVDIETERRLIAAVDDIFAGRTRIIVSHRRETLGGADILVELRDGRLMVQDTPA